MYIVYWNDKRDAIELTNTERGLSRQTGQQGAASKIMYLNLVGGGWCKQ